MLTSCLAGDRAITNGLIIGSLIGNIFFVIAWWTLGAIVREENNKASPVLLVVTIIIFLLKFLLFGISLWFAFKYISINPFALVGGIAVTQIAIVVSGLNKLLSRQEK